MNSLKHLLHKQLSETTGGRSLLNRGIILLVVLSIVVVVLETEPTLYQAYPWWFVCANIVFGVLFTIEYVARVWVCDMDERFLGQGWTGRFKYMRSPLAVIDLMALIPFYTAFLPESFVLRFFRLLRLISIAKLGRYSEALQEIITVIYRMRHALFISVCMSILIMFGAASGMYLLESTIQPDHFGSIPRAMWWGVITLSTIGYGDVYPVTILGKIFAGMYALSTISVVGLPAAILAGGFANVFQKRIMEEDS